MDRLSAFLRHRSHRGDCLDGDPSDSPYHIGWQSEITETFLDGREGGRVDDKCVSFIMQAS